MIEPTKDDEIDSINEDNEQRQQQPSQDIPHRQYAPVQQIDVKDKSVSMQEIANERANRKPKEMVCQHCNHVGMTKVQKECTCCTILNWIALFFLFCVCICIICCYTPMQRGGLIQDYLECKCLNRSIVHYCEKCGKKIAVKHPTMTLRDDSSDSDEGDDEESLNGSIQSDGS